MPDVALKLLRGAAEDARRRHDAEALHGLLRLMARVRARVPAQLAWQADLIAEIAQRRLEEARSASPPRDDALAISAFLVQSALI